MSLVARKRREAEVDVCRTMYSVSDKVERLDTTSDVWLLKDRKAGTVVTGGVGSSVINEDISGRSSSMVPGLGGRERGEINGWMSELSIRDWLLIWELRLMQTVMRLSNKSAPMQ